MSKFLLAMALALALSACATTGPDQPERPPIQLDAATEARILEQAARAIEGSWALYSVIPVPFRSATIMGPSPVRTLIRSEGSIIYCVDVMIETLILPTAAHAAIVVEYGTDGRPVSKVYSRRGSTCGAGEKRPFPRVIALREARMGRGAAAPVE